MIYSYPDTSVYNYFLPKEFESDDEMVQATSSSALNGELQVLTLSGARFKFSMTFREHTYSHRAELEAFLRKLHMSEHRVQLWHMARPAPRGTANLAGVTVSAAAAQFAETMVLTGVGANKTLLAGDMLSVVLDNGLVQLVMVNDNATANGSGVITINFSHKLRWSVSAGAAVTLSKPFGLFILTDKPAVPYGPQGNCPEFGVTFTEVFS